MERKYRTEEDIDRDLPRVDEPAYGDTDVNPNADDQRDAHHAEPDEHV